MSFAMESESRLTSPSQRALSPVKRQKTFGSEGKSAACEEECQAIKARVMFVHDGFGTAMSPVGELQENATKQRKQMGRYMVSDPEICHGKPTFLGTRIMVTQVLKQVAKGMPWDAITADWRGMVTKRRLPKPSPPSNWLAVCIARAIFGTATNNSKTAREFPTISLARTRGKSERQWTGVNQTNWAQAETRVMV